MSTGHDDSAGREELGRISRRGFLRTAVTTAAVVGASSALAAPALAQDTSSRGGGRHRVPRDQISIQLFTLRDQLAIDFEGTLATLAEIGYTRVEHAGFVGRTVTEFKAALDANGHRATSGHVLHPPALRPGRLERLAGRRQHAGVALHRAPVLRDQLRHRRGGPDHGTLAGVRPRPEPGRPAWPGTPGSSSATTTTTGSSSASPTTRRGPPSTSSPTPPTPTWSIWSWTCSGPPGGPATRSTCSSENRGRVLQYHVKDMNQAGSFADPGAGPARLRPDLPPHRQAGVARVHRRA